MDDPSFTQPLMYKAIESRESVPDLYVKQLIGQHEFTEEERKKLVDEHTEKLMKEFKAMDQAPPRAVHLGGNWKGESTGN